MGVYGKISPLVLILIISHMGCQYAQEYRMGADKTAYQIIEEKQVEGLGKIEPFTIELPSLTFRKKLLLDQNLLYSGPASLGSASLEMIPHMSGDDYFKTREVSEATPPWSSDNPIRITILDALQIAARNSRDYQNQKESVFRSALDLDLERDEFRNTFSGMMEELLSTERGTDPDTTGIKSSGNLGITRKFKTGMNLSSQIALDLVKLLTLDRSQSLGIFADASISIPLLRGAGRQIVSEPLIQAERNIIYELYNFERFKQTFSVRIANEYLGTLQELNQVENAEQNYKGLIASARRARRLSDAGRLPEFQFDQAIQDELRARNRWIQSRQSYAARLDSFKITLGLPPDANIKLDSSEFVNLKSSLVEILSATASLEHYTHVPPADAPIELKEPDMENAGPYELEENSAVKLALDNRHDLRNAEGKVFDAQRAIMVAGDRLRPELTLFGSASTGSRRSVSSAGSPDARLEPDEGSYSGLLTLDLPFERTSERNAYRESYITLEQNIRALQELEDRIKLDVRNDLRDLLEFRESLKIQYQAVALAERRVRSTNLFLEAGRAEIRDLLEAQEALLSAQNALTSAMVSYRIGELSLQRDLGVLQVQENGQWIEYTPLESR